MMNWCAYQQQNNNNNAVVRGGAEGEMMNGVVCPKPRRLGVLNPSINDPIVCRSSPRRQQHFPVYQSDMCESKASADLLDMILSKGCYGVEKSNNFVPSSPPFFCGSPPSRASNPVIQDSQFGNEKASLLSDALFERSPSSSARRNGGSCARVKFGQKPATVRVEGFNCRGISAVA